jgi:hypothetical protein
MVAESTVRWPNFGRPGGADLHLVVGWAATGARSRLVGVALREFGSPQSLPTMLDA